MRYRNKNNINLFNNPLKREVSNLELKNSLESKWYDLESEDAYKQLEVKSDLLPMDMEFENWFADFYDNNSIELQYDRDFAYFSSFPHGNNLRFLELGFGNGCLSRFFIRRNIEVHSCEISRAYARFLVQTEPLANVASSCAEILPFKNDSFDIVTTFMALHHFNLDLTLPEIIRVLKPGGRGIFMEPLLNSKILYMLRQIIPIKDNESPGGGGINSHEIESRLQNAGVQYNMREFEFFTRLERLPFLNKFQIVLRKIDFAILSRSRFLRHYSRTAVIEICKPAR